MAYKTAKSFCDYAFFAMERYDSDSSYLDMLACALYWMGFTKTKDWTVRV